MGWNLDKRSRKNMIAAALIYPCLGVHWRPGELVSLFFPGQDSGPGFSLSIAPSGRGGLGEMVGWAPPLVND